MRALPPGPHESHLPDGTVVRTLAGPTCPVCWPWVKISQPLADLHRVWHRLRDATMMASARADQTGSEADTARWLRCWEAQHDFETRNLGLTS